MVLTVPLTATLAMVADAAGGAADSWWIIGSAAVALHGCEVGPVKDVDLLMSAPDAEAFLTRVGVPHRSGQPDEQFRSLVFGTWNEPPIPVEVMGGFSIAATQGWRDVVLSTREAVEVAGRMVFVPSRHELIGLLHAFGREKDIARARLLGG